jgi:hypothetical protein
VRPGGPTVRPGSQIAPGIEVGGPTAHSGSQTTHEIEAGGPTATLRRSDRQALHNTSIAYFVDFGHDPRGTHITRGPGDHDFGRATCGTGQLYPQHYSHHPRAVREPSTPPLHQRPLLTKAVPVAPPVNPRSLTMRVKWGFYLSANRLILLATSASVLSPTPSSVRATLIDPNWRCAMAEEFATMIANNTCDLFPRPVGSNVITEKWIFKYKFNSDGSQERYKAC